MAKVARRAEISQRGIPLTRSLLCWHDLRNVDLFCDVFDMQWLGRLAVEWYVPFITVCPRVDCRCVERDVNLVIETLNGNPCLSVAHALLHLLPA